MYLPAPYWFWSFIQNNVQKVWLLQIWIKLSSVELASMSTKVANGAQTKRQLLSPMTLKELKKGLTYHFHTIVSTAKWPDSSSIHRHTDSMSTAAGNLTNARDILDLDWHIPAVIVSMTCVKKKMNVDRTKIIHFLDFSIHFFSHLNSCIYFSFCSINTKVWCFWGLMVWSHEILTL